MSTSQEIPTNIVSQRKDSELGDHDMLCLKLSGSEVAVIMRNMLPGLTSIAPLSTAPESLPGPSAKSGPTSVPGRSELPPIESPRKASITQPRKSFEKFEFWYIGWFPALA